MINKMKQLALASYTDGQLDIEKVNRIVNFLTRSELKQYIKGLKLVEKRSTVIIDLPFDQEQAYQKEFQTLFPEKQIVMRIDPSLLLGARITDDDIVYSMNLKDRLNILESHIEEDYD